MMKQPQPATCTHPKSLQSNARQNMPRFHAEFSDRSREARRRTRAVVRPSSGQSILVPSTWVKPHRWLKRACRGNAGQDSCRKRGSSLIVCTGAPVGQVELSSRRTRFRRGPLDAAVCLLSFFLPLSSLARSEGLAFGC